MSETDSEIAGRADFAIEVTANPDRGADRAATLGLLSLGLGLLGPFAIRASLRSWRRIASSQGALSGRFPALIGLVCGVISTGLLAAGLLWFAWANLP